MHVGAVNERNVYNALYSYIFQKAAGAPATSKAPSSSHPPKHATSLQCNQAMSPYEPPTVDTPLNGRLSLSCNFATPSTYSVCHMVSTSHSRTVLIWYEYILTLDGELQHMWGRKPSWAFVLFAINRYGLIACTFPLLLQQFAWYGLTSKVSLGHC